MATMILSTVGSSLGGPIGGLLGTLVGQSIDQQLFGHGPRKGPRLNDLKVQTSCYGTPIPRIYGAMRAAGSVVWSTDLIETQSLQGDGKNQPETVQYSYRASFAVALSSRRAARIGRVWAEGKLVRGAAGDLKTGGKLRFLPGSEDQPVDPAIASVEGLASSPAYRGLALAVFEDLPLETFGNRVPSLTFEIFADEPPPTLGGVLADASGGAVQTGDARPVAGLALEGANLAEALDDVIAAYGLEVAERDGAFRDPPAGVRAIAGEALGADGEGRAVAPVERSREAAGRVPASVTLTYFDPARDYLAGQARAALPMPSRSERTVALPAALAAGAAKALAETMLTRSWARREGAAIRLGPAGFDLAPGAVVTVEGLAGEWRVEASDIEHFVNRLTLRPVPAVSAARPADPGRVQPQPDVVVAALTGALMDLTEDGGAGPSVQLALASPSNSYRQAAVTVTAGGTSRSVASAAREAIVGTVAGALGPGSAAVFDLLNAIDVTLVNADKWLVSADDVALAAGANLAAVGDELIQFARADPLGGGQFRLSRLLRGRRGSEAAIEGHAAGERFVLIEPGAIAAIPIGLAQVGGTISVSVTNPTLPAAPTVMARVADGRSARPLSPAQLRGGRDSAGGATLSWVRRSRAGYDWLDNVDAPPDADHNGFRLRVTGAGGSGESDTAAETRTLTAAEVSAVGGFPLTIEVRQIGAALLSPPASLVIS